MTVMKIAGWVALVLAVVAAFLTIPYVALALALVGVVIGWSSPADAHVRVIVSAVALRSFAGAFDDLPAVGPHLTAILNNVAIVLGGLAIIIILRNIYNRLTT